MNIISLVGRKKNYVCTWNTIQLYQESKARTVFFFSRRFLLLSVSEEKCWIKWGRSRRYLHVLLMGSPEESRWTQHETWFWMEVLVWFRWSFGLIQLDSPYDLVHPALNPSRISKQYTWDSLVAIQQVKFQEEVSILLLVTFPSAPPRRNIPVIWTWVECTMRRCEDFCCIHKCAVLYTLPGPWRSRQWAGQGASISVRWFSSRSLTGWQAINQPIFQTIQSLQASMDLLNRPRWGIRVGHLGQGYSIKFLGSKSEGEEAFVCNLYESRWLSEPITKSAKW